MLNALSAESLKARKNLWMMGFTVYLLPIGAVAGVLLVILMMVLGNEIDFSETTWTGVVEGALLLPNSFLGQVLFMAFTSSVFAGEFGWNTWKAILPRNRRLWILISKYVVIAVSILLALNALALVALVGSWIVLSIANEPITPALISSETAEFIRSYLITLLSVFSTIMMASIYAVIAAIITRSVIGGAIAGIIMILLDSVSLPILILIQDMTGAENLLPLYQIMPSYQIANINSWLSSDMGWALPTLTAPAAGVSLFVLLLWIGSCILISLAWFMRQDM